MAENILIDGVDVSGCEHFSGTYAKECKAVYANSGYKELHDLKCNKSPNCYYKQLKAKEQECEELKEYLNQIRDEELSHLDIEWDEYETSARQEDYSNIITLVERALGEIND